MAEGDVRQYFVRNDQGTIWGPLALPTIELLIENGAIQGRLQVSEDGINFAAPGRFPHLRNAFPREHWGDVVPPAPRPPGAPAAGPGVGPAAPPPGAVPPGAPAPAAARPAAPGAVPQRTVTAPGIAPGVATHPAAPGAAPQRTVTAPGIAPGVATRPAAPGAAPQRTATAPGTAPGVATHPAAPAAAPQRTVTAPGIAPGVATRPAAPGAPAQPAPGAPPPATAPGTPPAAAARPTPAPAPASPAPAPAAAPASEEGPPASGRLETHSPVRLYGLLAAGNHTGLLTLTLSDCTVSIHFRKGNPEFIDSSHPEDALGTSLLQAKLLSPEQLQQAEASKGRFGGDLLGALFSQGLLQPTSAFLQLAQRAQSILLKGLRAESGAFTFEAKDLPAAKAMPLGNKWAVLSDLVRRIPSADLLRRLQPVLNLPVMKSNGRVATGDLRLTPHEVRVLALIDGVRSVGQLLKDLPQDAEHLLRLVFLLKELDGVSFAAPSQRGASQAAARPGPATTQPGVTPQAAAPRPGTPPGTAAPQAPRPAAAPASPAPAAARPAAPAATAPGSTPGADEIPVLRELAVKLKEQNHFERLGLGADTNGPAVKIAYFKLAKQYHPDTLPPGAPPELEKLKADVFAYISEAYRTLSDDKSRAAYIEELKSGGKQEQQVDVEAILKSEELFRKAGLYIKARKFADAVKMLDEAISLNEEPEFYAWRGYARFFIHEDKKVAYTEAYRDLQLCLKKNEKIASAYYFLGVIAKLCGDNSGALKHFQKTVELQPNHIDAQREIRMAAQKK